MNKLVFFVIKYVNFVIKIKNDKNILKLQIKLKIQNSLLTSELKSAKINRSHFCEGFKKER